MHYSLSLIHLPIHFFLFLFSHSTISNNSIESFFPHINLVNIFTLNLYLRCISSKTLPTFSLQIFYFTFDHQQSPIYQKTNSNLL